VGIWMLYLLVSRRGPELLAAVPAAAHPDPLWNYSTGIELGVSSSIGWWAYLGAMIRMAPNGRVIAMPVMLGMGASVPLLSLIGVAGVLVLKSADPSAWLRTIGGPAYAFISLSFVAAANCGTAVVGVYASAIGLRNFRIVAELPWRGIVFLTLAPVAIVGVFIPELFFSHFASFIACVSVAFSPICGIQLADYYLLRRRHLSIRGIYDERPQGDYFYRKGLNWVAICSFTVGIGVYTYLLNPLTYSSHQPYQLVTASVPTVLLSGALYFVLTRVFVMPGGLGGYPE
jgi:NCS1 family nucleobase:cation symporter-1